MGEQLAIVENHCAELEAQLKAKDKLIGEIFVSLIQISTSGCADTCSNALVNYCDCDCHVSISKKAMDNVLSKLMIPAELIEEMKNMEQAR